MAKFIEADVIQKIATEAEWLTQTRIPYKGQIMIVSDSNGIPVNQKVGNGVDTFADLKYMFDFTNSQRISAVPPGVLPAPEEANTYMVVTEVGDYTYGGNTIASITEDGYQATLWWNGSSWVSNGVVRVKGGNVNLTMTDIPLYYNLFDKNTMVKDGFTLKSDGSGGDEPNINATCSNYIKVNNNFPIYALRGWTGTPAFVIFYDQDKNYISQKNLGSSFKDGIVDANASKNIHFIRTNLWSLSSGTNKEDNINSLMIYSGEVLISEYQPYVKQFDTIDGYEIYISEDKISGAVNSIISHDRREQSYSEAVNSLPLTSRLSPLNEISGSKVGEWQIRPNGTSLVKDGDAFKFTLTGASSNQGLLFPGFFFQSDIGRTVYISFEAKRISGSSLVRVFANSGVNFVDFQVDDDWSMQYNQVVVGVNEYGDRRLIFALGEVGVASEILIKNISVSFTPKFNIPTVDPSKLAYKIGKMPNLLKFCKELKRGNSVLTQLGVFGDSWTDGVPGAIYYVRDLSRLLREEFGNGGGGWYSFSVNSGNNQKMACADPNDADDTRSGSITYTDALSTSKDITVSDATFHVGSSLTLNIKTSHTKLIIQYYGGGGVFTYSLDGESSVSVDTSSLTGRQSIELSVSDSPHTLEFNIISGSVMLFGVNMLRDEGIVVHKFGNRGLQAYHYSYIDPVIFTQAVSFFDLNATTLLIGTNDRTVGRLPGDFKGYINVWISMIQDAHPEVDMMLISPSNNNVVATYDMVYYSDQMQQLANEYSCAFLNLIPLFGSVQKIVTMGLFADDVHPTDIMGDVIADEIHSAIFI